MGGGVVLGTSSFCFYSGLFCSGGEAPPLQVAQPNLGALSMTLMMIVLT